MARGRERGRDRTLLLCASVTTELSLAVRPHSAQGLVAIVTSRSAPGAEVELSQPTMLEDLTPMRELDAARAAQEHALVGHGYAAAKTLGTGSAKVGERITLPVELPKGCARLDIVGGKPLAGIIAELWDDKGAMLAESTGGKGGALFPCGAGGPARVDSGGDGAARPLRARAPQGRRRAAEPRRAPGRCGAPPRAHERRR